MLTDDSLQPSTSLLHVNSNVDNFYESLVQHALQAEADAQQPMDTMSIPDLEDVEVDDNPEILLMSHDSSGTPMILGTVILTLIEFPISKGLSS